MQQLLRFMYCMLTFWTLVTLTRYIRYHSSTSYFTFADLDFNNSEDRHHFWRRHEAQQLLDEQRYGIDHGPYGSKRWQELGPTIPVIPWH